MVQGQVVNNNYKIVWVYNGHSETVPDMYDKPKQLCKWWMRQHARDSQYAKGKFCLVSMMMNHTS